MRRRFTVKKSSEAFGESHLWEVMDHVGKYNPYCICYARVRAKSIAAALNTMEAGATVAAAERQPCNSAITQLSCKGCTRPDPADCYQCIRGNKSDLFTTAK